MPGAGEGPTDLPLSFFSLFFFLSFFYTRTGSESPDYGGAVGVEEGQEGVHRTPPGSRTRWQASGQERQKGRPARFGAALPL